MEDEKDVRKLLKIRNDLEQRIEQMQTEIEDIKAILMEIDHLIVTQGFRQSAQKAEEKTTPQSKKLETNIGTEPVKASLTPDGSSIQAKDGTILGRVIVTQDTIVFKPREEMSFTVSTPPFQSFLLDRVLENMKITDETRSNSGEISPDQILNYIVETDVDVIKSITIKNYGGERRLREIQSSLRWSFDKMFDKLKRG